MALVFDLDSELLGRARYRDLHGSTCSAVLDGVGEQVREQLFDALWITWLTAPRIERVCGDLAARVLRLNLGDDVTQALTQIGDVRGVELDAAAQPARARSVKSSTSAPMRRVLLRMRSSTRRSSS